MVLEATTERGAARFRSNYPDIDSALTQAKIMGCYKDLISEFTPHPPTESPAVSLRT